MKNLIAFFMLVFSVQAFSSVAVGPWTGTAVGGTAHYTANPGTTYTKTVEAVPSGSTITDTGSQYRIPNKVVTPLPNGSMFEAELVTDLSKASVAAGLWEAVKKGRANPWVTACFVLCPALVDQGWKWMNDSKQWVHDGNAPKPVESWHWQDRVPGYLTPDEACYDFQRYWGSNDGGLTFISFDGARCKYSTGPGAQVSVRYSPTVSKRASCPIGFTLGNNVCAPNTNQPDWPLTDDEITSGVNNAMSKLGPAASIKSSDGFNPIPLDGASQTATPLVSRVETPEKTISKETTNNPDGTITTTETKQHDVTNITNNNNSNSTVNNSSVTYNTTTITNTYLNGSSAPATTKEEPTKEPEDAGSVADKTMPEQPKLYEPKYPDGPAGVWNANKPSIETTEFYNGIKSMFPSMGGGACPAFKIPSISLGAFGSLGAHTFDVPCWIFSAIGLILLTTAAFTARKIIF